jgi:hypothetical protein
VSPFVRTVKTGSGATAVQIVWRKRAGKRDIEHVGSAHGEAEPVALKAAAWQRVNRGQDGFDLSAVSGPAPSAAQFKIVASRSARLWQALERAYDTLGFDRAVGDSVFKSLVLARVEESDWQRPTRSECSKIWACPRRRTPAIKRRLGECVAAGWRGTLEEACARHAGVDKLRLKPVRRDHAGRPAGGTGSASRGSAEERRSGPQIVVGLSATAGGFPLTVHEFEGNKAETKTMIPVLRGFAEAPGVSEPAVVAGRRDDVGGQHPGVARRRVLLHRRPPHWV